MEIYLVRHTETSVDKGYCYGQSDVPLLSPFLGDFDKILKGLDVMEAVVYSSPLDRCVQFANYFKTNNPSVEQLIFDNRLKEINFGDWELKEWNKIDPIVLNPWMQDFVNYKVPNGESFIELYNRVSNFIDEELIKKNHQTPVVIVTHAGVIRSFLCNVLDLQLKNAFKISVDYGSITKVILSENNSYCRVEFANKKVI